MKTQRFLRTVRLPCSAAAAFAWHERPGALERLIPPWERARVLRTPGGGVREGGRVELETRVGLRGVYWEAEHFGYERGRQFCDRLLRGPLPYWEHRHVFLEVGANESELTDDVTYALPGGALGEAFDGRVMRRRLERLFSYRHATVQADLALAPVPPLRVLVSGASGLVGHALGPFLSTQGHSVRRLVRRPVAGSDEIFWDPARGTVEISAADEIDAVVHLAGENLAAGRWTPARKEAILRSRVDGTRTLVAALTRLRQPPRVLVSASAVGYYGDRGDEALTEDSPAGAGFLADVCRAWEAELAPASAAGIRTVALRSGVVLTPAGGALAKMLPVFRAGAAGRLGGGRQWMSWISIDDLVGAIGQALVDERCSEAVNTVAPVPVSNREFTATLAGVLRRPAILPAPAAALRLALGEMADAALLSSTRAIPARLLAVGYRFRHPMLEEALRHVLGRG